MAKCQQCGKGPQYGNNRPWSKKTTRRRWDVNVQKVNVIEGNKVVSKRMCASCIRTLSKA
ncbi:MAG: 50S ribosomal protein L28 [Anaerolineales bacterium]|nr:50S ribosomal protein L28 [Anaerolineales bacterium]